MGPRALKLLTLTAALVALAGVIAIAGWTQLQQYLGRPGPSPEPVTVVLERGSGVAAIAEQLEAARVIRQPWMFRLAVRMLDRDRDLKAGEYAFPARATPRGVIGMLSKGETVARRVTVAEGLTVREIYGILERAEGLSGELPEPPPEGSLLPETYFYAYGDSRRDLVRRMREAMAATLDELWPERAEGLPYRAPEEALIMASIVDKETSVDGERAEVAAVFLNRLQRGMRLQSDPTVIYGLTEGDGPLDRELTRKDWEHDSTYNTYRIDGLPPAPIANPGRAAIEAVLNPADVDYLYFVADGSGGHAFARSLEEHNRNVAAWRRIRNGIQPRPIAPSPPKPDPAS
ncbi:MAG TPA: endolytic transglycosylase MltG [Geminicoccaceae bacterium]